MRNNTTPLTRMAQMEEWVAHPSSDMLYYPQFQKRKAMESAGPNVRRGQTATLLMAPDYAWVRDQEPFHAFCSPYSLGISSLS